MVAPNSLCPIRSNEVTQGQIQKNMITLELAALATDFGIKSCRIIRFTYSSFCHRKCHSKALKKIVFFSWSDLFHGHYFSWSDQ